MLENKRILITGGTGSLGKVLLRRILSGEQGNPKKVIVYSRDEAKQHELRLALRRRRAATDELIYRNSEQVVEFQIGDVRDSARLRTVLRRVDIVVNAAALKQVPTCEYFPYEAVLTNITGAQNIVQAIRESQLPIDVVLGVSTDKACKPVNVMGMTKAVQERILLAANLECPGTRFVCVRYGNVLASRGSVIPLFHEQIRSGGPVTITTPDMTRFLLTLEQAVDTVFAALKGASRGDTYVPRPEAARIVDIAAALIGDLAIETRITGIRPGEKVHEILISEEEIHRVIERGAYYVLQPTLPELRQSTTPPSLLSKEFCSADVVVPLDRVRELLAQNRLRVEDQLRYDDEMLA